MSVRGTAGALARRPGTLEQRERTLAVAGRVLAERGFERTRLRDVAEAAGVSIGLLQNYFETRDAMLEEAFSFMCEELIGRWREHAQLASDPWQKIAGLIEELMTEPDPRAHSATWTEFCSSRVPPSATSSARRERVQHLAPDPRGRGRGRPSARPVPAGHARLGFGGRHQRRS